MHGTFGFTKALLRVKHHAKKEAATQFWHIQRGEQQVNLLMADKLSQEAHVFGGGEGMEEIALISF